MDDVNVKGKNKSSKSSKSIKRSDEDMFYLENQQVEQLGDLGSDGGRHWYIVQTYSSYENRVKADLEKRIESMGMSDRIFQVLVPVEHHIVLKEGRPRQTKRKLFPSYVLVEMILDEKAWHVVRHTPGVTGFIGAGNHPVPLKKSEVERLMSTLKKSEESEPERELEFEPGDQVIVIMGQAKGQSGTVTEVLPDDGLVKFKSVLNGTETVFEVDYKELKKI